MQDETAADMDLGGEAPGGADVFADVPADGGIGEPEPTPPPTPVEGALGGDGATLDELGSEEPLADEAPINGEGDGALPAQPADPLAEPTPDAPAEEPTPAEDPPAEPEPEPVPEAPAEEPEAKPEPEAKAKPASKKGGGKKGTTQRTYHVFKEDENGNWEEAIEGGVTAGNAEAAYRAAYSFLVEEDKGDALRLSVVPQHYWNPRTVQAKVRHERAVEIG